ncbi:NEDD8 ultimate buster 1 [Linum perenne]
MAKLRVAGTWTGVLEEVDLENWTVPTLREEVAKRSNVSPGSINLICAGRILKDGDGSEKLSQLGVKNNSKVLASRVAVDEGKSLKDELIAEEDRNRRLTRVKALMMGLMLHTNGKGLIRKEMFRDALEVLTMAEESFSLCNQKIVERVDNIAMLQMDMVWCYFMLKDIACLSVAGARLEKAREGFERAHGKDASRLKLLQVGNSSGLALYLRLELLEAVVAYHSGQFEKSRTYLMSAQTKFKQLQISDEALSVVMGMGFKESEAKRALRINNQDVERAVEFLVDEKARKALKREEDIRREIEIKEQKRYGVTPLKKAVDIELLKTLVSIGFERELAAEALRRNENDTQKALDDLTNPETNATIQDFIVSRKVKRQRKHVDSKIQQLVSMGFDTSRDDFDAYLTVAAAVQGGGSVEQIMQQLLQQGSDPNPEAPTEAARNADADVDASNLLSTDVIPEDEIASTSVQHRDAEMEDEIADEVAKRDALSDYDNDVTIEGEAINEYLALLDSSGTTSTSG